MDKQLDMLRKINYNTASHLTSLYFGIIAVLFMLMAEMCIGFIGVITHSYLAICLLITSAVLFFGASYAGIYKLHKLNKNWKKMCYKAYGWKDE